MVKWVWHCCYTHFKNRNRRMKRKLQLHKRMISAVLLFTMFVAGVTTSYGSTLKDAKDKRNEAQQKLDKVNKEIAEINKKQDALQAQMNAYDNELMALLTDLTLLKEDILYKEAEIEQAEMDLAAAEKRAAEQYDAMKLRIQYMYENSNGTLWMTLVASDNFTDALNRAEYITDVYEYDRNQLTEFQETVQKVADLKERLDGERIELEELQVNMQEQQKELEGLIARSEAQMAGIKEQMADASALAKQYAKTIKQQNQVIVAEEARIAAEKAAQQAANNSNAGSTNSNSSSSGSESSNSAGLTGGANPSHSTGISGQDVVNYASQFVGNPYVFGGSSLTNGCDCSYFTQACFGHFGISLPRTSYSQRSSGQAVSYANAQAGDIICYAGHVAIYMGNGKIVHAANERLGICYGSATYRTIVAVRRVL